LLEDPNEKQITIRATGKAISTALVVTQLIKERFGNLHQDNRIYSMEVTDTYEPKT